MTEQIRDGGDELDLATIARDDQLLDVLGHGGPGPADDEVAAMLAAWRADVDDDGEQRLVRAATEAPVPAATAATPISRGILRLAAAVVALLVLASGLGVGSRNAGPTSPLWSLTRVLYPEQAQVRTVEDGIARARAAVAAGRLDEARHLVREARRTLADVDDPAVATRLGADLDALDRALLAVPPVPPAAPSADPRTQAAPTTTPAPTGAAPAPAPATPRPTPSSERPGLPNIPSLPPLLPSPGRSGETPSLPLPSLPGLPLPTGIPLG
ncbi:anti-sigma-D factor RsdA [Micromonospora sp. WMMD812]|uniref:anti-sigma-D factor RsdA n=1 Tax=Micromonospora sp. WMMD812 TaxID=3015152 RepID=UPI00248CE4A5|nr:anti-sigma-D factor RsdA [Micromonospora sp. WMMD812]WBB69958.1 anti-sigma-D factor RsdA [Micromonospora sp. WMMD812]